MSYNNSGIDLLFYSTDQETLHTFSSKFREKLDKKGGEYSGPMTLKTANPGILQAFLLHITDPNSDETADRDDFPEWLFEVLDSEEDLETLVSASMEEQAVFGCQYQIMGDHVVASILSFDLPDEVSSVATSIKKTHQKGNNDPYTWNPNVDHIPSHPNGPW